MPGTFRGILSKTPPKKAAFRDGKDVELQLTFDQPAPSPLINCAAIAVAEISARRLSHRFVMPHRRGEGNRIEKTVTGRQTRYSWRAFMTCDPQ